MQMITKEQHFTEQLMGNTYRLHYVLFKPYESIQIHKMNYTHKFWTPKQIIRIVQWLNKKISNKDKLYCAIQCINKKHCNLFGIPANSQMNMPKSEYVSSFEFIEKQLLPLIEKKERKNK